MQRLEEIISGAVVEAAKELWSADVSEQMVQVQKTRKDFSGDLTVVVFPLVRIAKKSPEETANVLGHYLKDKCSEIEDYNVIKGFLNLVIAKDYWLAFISDLLRTTDFGIVKAGDDSLSDVVEYSSPNTNKPLHLGHVRNNLLGYSISQILEAAGKKVKKVNLINDRGIHICKSMIAWQKFGNGATPESTGLKGDKLVGDYYVKFDQEYKKQIAELVKGGQEQKEAESNATLMIEAREMLLKWEAGDAEVRALWEKMNAWVYAGFDKTYEQMGVSFDQIYYESETYKLGKKIILDGLEKGVLIREEDGSVWADLTDKKLDKKILLRSDGTSVYMTQDVGTAHQRYSESSFDQHIYVVGNEQNYHFQVLKLVLEKLGFAWANKLHHLSYGMVELPEGKMKSREGTVVDADELMEEMIQTARRMSDELGKLGDYSDSEKQTINRQVGMGALKYFILKVDPKRNMLFDPKESIDFNGNTGPFIQYTYARIQSVLRKSGAVAENVPEIEMNEKEVGLAKLLYEFPDIIQSSAETHNPAVIANYMYELAKEFNQFYHDYSILGADNEEQKLFRIQIAEQVGKLIFKGMSLLGIEVPERM
jgi:arginyl-tRNA synthetase